MTKKEILDHIVHNTTLTRSQAAKAYDSIIKAIKGSLIKGENVYLRDFATLKVVKTKARRARLFKRGTSIVIPTRNTVKFKSCETLKKQMNYE